MLPTCLVGNVWSRIRLRSCSGGFGSSPCDGGLVQTIAVSLASGGAGGWSCITGNDHAQREGRARNRGAEDMVVVFNGHDGQPGHICAKGFPPPTHPLPKVSGNAKDEFNAAVKSADSPDQCFAFSVVGASGKRANTSAQEVRDKRCLLAMGCEKLRRCG